MPENFNTEFTYEFKIPFTYAYQGEMIEAQKITIKSPTNSIRQFVIKIDEQRLIAAKNWQNKIDISKEDEEDKKDKEENNKKESKELGKDIVEFIGAGGGDLSICFEALKNILKSGNQEIPIAVIDNETKVTSPLFDNFSYIDAKNILGEYIKNFLLSSHQN